MSARPIDDRVLVRPDPAQEVTAGGIILPDKARKKSQTGTVLAVGPGAFSRFEADGERDLILCDGPPPALRAPMTLRPGDRVHFGRYTGSEVEVDGEELIVMRESEVLLVDNPEEV